MSFDIPNTGRPRVAIVGGGISGLASAYLLTANADVTLFEAAPRLGGHARTIVAGRNADQPVDTGFIVFNYVNYPHLTGMFRDLDVPVEKSDMTFGATIDDGAVEYALYSINALFAQRRNIARPAFARMVRDIVTFNARAEDVAKTDDVTIADLVKELNLGDWFQRYYLMPICGAIWSTPTEGIRDFPARTLVTFFRNHSLLERKQHQWWTVNGGSIEYVKRLTAHLEAQGADLRPNTPVRKIDRDSAGVTVHSERGAERFDQIIMACHPDQSLNLLSAPSAAEKAALSDVRFQDNTIILHRDEAQMPRRRACWSSWVYKAKALDTRPEIGVTYWMNRLQNIPENDPMFISLNPYSEIRDELIYDHNVFRHPVFDGPALSAQKRLADMQGSNATWFAGAWMRHGFHEDGFASAVRATREINAQIARVKVAA
ncbi:FAD-dependent oxidoreductase [uncultured Shimia sp.]|uniref:NAD(P)/FAD-dependent oxidoreductase n=1 Tax=uncultured Shimia sp. TaxID=573152 RepID=UPI00261F61ED|nr:FAD-dependent oxidoreductase [uncultured Shimia sp.]